MTEMRKDRRAPASLKVKYKSATVDDFIEQFGTDVSRGGIFIKTKKPLEAGALLKFEFQLQDGSAVLHGVGRVAWRRLEQQARPDLPAGMGIKFFKLSDHSRVVVERIESRFAGNKSRYELTDEAEFAAPLSGPPPTAADSGASVLPGNGRRGAIGSAPRTLPPPPAVSSIPPALADVPPRAPSAQPIRSSMRGAAAVLPKGTAGSFFPDTRKSSGSPASRVSGSPINRGSGSPVNRGSATPASRARDTSEFLASAFQAGGAGPEVRAQARAQAEHARRDPESVELARELFGDLADNAAQAASQPANNQPAASNTNTAPTHRPPPSGTPVNAFAISTPIPAVELPRSPVPRASRPSLADRIPSIEQLVDEAGRSEGSPSLPSSKSSKSGSSLPRVDSPGLAATQSAPLTAANQSEPEPLKLAMSVPTFRPAAQPAEDAPGRSKTLLFVALASTLVLGGVAVYIGMQRGQTAERARNAQAALDKTAAATAAAAAPSEPGPAAPAEPAPQPTAAEPVATAPVAGPEVPVAMEAKPRNAVIWLDGKQRGPAPQNLKLPSNVPVEVSVRSPGFATLTRTITPHEGAAPETFELAPLPYQLVLTSEPAGASVTSGSKSAVAPAPLELGHLESRISISVDKEGFQRSTRSVRLDEFHEQDGVMRAEIAISLTPLPVKRRAARAVAPPPTSPTSPTAAPALVNEAPPAPEPSSAPPVMQVKPETEAPAAAPAPEPEAKAKPDEPPQTAAAPEAPPAPPEPAP